MSTLDTADLFMQNAAKAAAGISYLDASGSLGAKVAELVPKGIAVFCPGGTELERIAAEHLATRLEDYTDAEITVEEVTAAIAETGSIVCTSAAGKAVQASLLPSHHIAIVPCGKIFATLDDFFAAHAAAPPTNMTFITGPSRTADIELNLVIGVHGPERLDIIVVQP